MTIKRAGEIDHDLPVEVVDLEIEQRTGRRDPGVVDEAEQRLSGKRGRDFSGAGSDRLFVRHVENQWRELLAERLRQAIGVHLLAYTAENVESVRDQNLDAAPANAGGDAGDDDRSH